MNIYPPKPLVTVLLPVYNSRRHLREAIKSIQAQTYTNWEMLVINEYGSNDGSSDIVQNLSFVDSRIRLIQNGSRLGLANSLNYGMQMAKGKYIARMDADDLSHETRFEKQVYFLEEHPEIGLCGTYQHHFGKQIDWIHKPPITPEKCRANMMFDCDLCHSTVMFRRQLFMDNQLFYNPDYLAEDFELWSRAVRLIEFANIPEVLGEYRWDGENISIKKQEQMAKENARIVAAALERNLEIKVDFDDYILLEGWGNPFFREKDKAIRKQMYSRFKELLILIYETNQKKHFYDEKALLSIIASKWRYVRYLEPRNVERTVSSLEEIFNPHYIPDYMLIWNAYKNHIDSPIDFFKKVWLYLKQEH